MTREAAVQTQSTPTNHPLSQGGILQRKCMSCGQHQTGGGTCAKCRSSQQVGKTTKLPVIQTKLTVGQPNDKYEKEANRVAEQVMRMPAPTSAEIVRPKFQPPQIQRMCTNCEEEKVQTKEVSGGVPEVTPTIASRIQSLQGGGQPLPTSTRHFFEPRFGQDFSHVRVRTDDSARALNARAYTVGRNIVFGAGQYSPETSKGRKLLAHELVHVVQNGDSHSIVRRAEVEDEDSVCRGLTDIRPDINHFVNGVLSTARSSPGITPLMSFLEKVLIETGGTGAVGPVEHFVEGLPATKRFLPSVGLAGTRFASLPSASGLGIPGITLPILGEMNIYDAHGRINPLNPTGPPVHVVGATAKINSICAGADKLGHFFQQGAQYFSISRSSSIADAESFGRATEIDRAGLGATGVYSNADLAANRAGLRFWERLVADPAGFSFDIADFIADDWNEYSNPNFYEASVAREIWATQLTGRWQGVFGLGPTLQDINVTLTATNTGSVRGSFNYSSSPAPSGVPVTGTITGAVIYQTTSVSGTISSSVLHGGSGSHSASPVSGIEIEFDWISGSNRGRGKWESIGERMLVGDFGNGSSRTNGGVFNIVKR